MNKKRRFFIRREQLKKIWQSADWQRVIEVFGLEIDRKRRSKANEIWIKSPFTDEDMASLHLNLTENIFKDFSSGKGSRKGILNFCQELLLLQGQKMNCYEVAQWMVDNGISAMVEQDKKLQSLGDNDGRGNKRDEKEKKGSPEKPDENKPINVDLRRWLQSNHPELQRRGISRATCQYLGCGYLPERSIGTKRSPLNGRLVFQIRGVREGSSGLKPVVLTHVGRALTQEEEKTNGKYWSFPFLKGLEIYNQDKLLLDSMARRQLEKYGLVLVEGFFDVAAMVSSGCLNVGALMGSQMTDKQVARLKFISSRVAIPKIKLFLDRDKTGIDGTKKAVVKLKDNGFAVEIFDWEQTFNRPGLPPVKIPPSIKDPGDMSATQLQWSRKHGKI
jgi:DNA primase